MTKVYNNWQFSKQSANYLQENMYFLLFRAKLLAQTEAFLVETFQLCDIATGSPHLHLALRTDNKNLTPSLHTLHHLQLFIVNLYTMTQGFTQMRILLIYKRRYIDIALSGTITLVARHDNNIKRMALAGGTKYGDGVDDTTVKQGNASDHRNLGDIRQ